MRDAAPELDPTEDSLGQPSAGCTNDCGFDRGRRAFMRSGLMAVAALTAVAGSSVPLHAMARTYARGMRQGDVVSYPMPAADGATLDDEHAVILVRYQGAVSAFSMRCPHKQTPLEWQPDNARFYCPKHKSTFQPEGTLIQGKATRNMDRHPVRLEEGKVVVDTSTTIRSSEDPAAWAAAVVKVG